MRINRTYRVASSLALLFVIASCSKREMSSHEAEVATAAAPAMGEAADAAAAAAPAARSVQTCPRPR